MTYRGAVWPATELPDTKPVTATKTERFTSSRDLEPENREKVSAACDHFDLMTAKVQSSKVYCHMHGSTVVVLSNGRCRTE